ncbi:MAG: hypothetical protein ACK4UJ_11390 [Leptonema sp. (in: bacteria)]
MGLNQIVNISYHPVLVEQKSHINYKYWDTIYNFYYDNKQKNNVEYFYHLLHYINKNFSIPKELEVPFSKTFGHGTAKIKIYFNSEIYNLYSPFVKIKSDSLIVPLLRKISEVNFGQLTLAQIFLKGDHLYFYYEDSMENNDPHKVFSIIDEICYYSDYYDNYFIEKMNVEFAEKPDVKHLLPDELQKIYNQYLEILNEAFEYYEIFKNINYYNNIKNIFLISLLKIHYLLQPQGTLRIEIDNLITQLLQNSKKDIKELVEESYPHLENLKNLSKEKFKEYFYKVDFFLFPLKKANLKTAQSFLKDYYQILADWFQKEYYTDCTTYGILNLLDFLDRYYVEEDIKLYLDSILKESAKKDWKTSATIIFDCYNKILQNSIPSIQTSVHKPNNDNLRKPIPKEQKYFLNLYIKNKR